MKPVTMSILDLRMAQRGCRGDHTAVNLAGGEDNHPDTSLGVLVSDAVANVQCESAVEEDSEKLQADDALPTHVHVSEVLREHSRDKAYQINTCPSLVRSRINHPKLREESISSSLWSIESPLCS